MIKISVNGIVLYCCHDISYDKYEKSYRLHWIGDDHEEEIYEKCIKIEKRVKDLTKKEIYIYVISTYEREFKNFSIYADCISIELKSGKFITLYDEDYVDITEIAKELY